MSKFSAAERRSRLDHLRVKHLRLIELVAKTGSLTAAANQLSLTQPAVTGMAHDLEAAFNATLFERTTRGARLTAAGHMALERLRHSLASLDAAVTASNSSVVEPLIRIGVLPVTSISLVPTVVRELQEQGNLPRMSFHQASAGSMLELLHRGRLDCVLGVLNAGTIESERFADLDFEYITTDGLLVACAPDHPLARRRNVKLRELLAEEWILPEHSTHTRRMVEGMFLAEELPPPQPKLESSAFYANLAIVNATSMLTMAPTSAVRRSEKEGQVHALALKTAPLHNQVFFITHKQGPKMAGLRVLADAFKRHGATYLPK
jgi:DNA-binding transcriptional LysR family regulator